MKNLANDSITATVLCVIAAATACGGASSTQGSEPAKTTAAPASSGGAAPASSAAGGAHGKDQINAVIKNHSQDLKVCYVREKDRAAAANGPPYKGDTKFRVKIDAAGKVTDLQGVDIAPAGDFLASCVSDFMKSWSFPGTGSVSTVTIPLTW